MPQVHGHLFPMDDLSDHSSEGDNVSMATSESGFPLTFADAFELWPLEKWIHLRFCSSYHVHNWAHDRLTRVLLFHTFVHQQTLPSPQEILTAVRVSEGIRQKLGMDIWSLIEPIVLEMAMQAWKDLAGDAKWTPPFGKMSKDERGEMVILSDAIDSLKFHTRDPVISDGPPAFMEALSFLTNPIEHCTDQPDILEVTAAEGRSIRVLSFDSFDIPYLDPDDCTCHKCIALQKHLQINPENFQMKYLRVCAADGRGSCNALEKTWEPLFSQAEGWVERLMDRIDCPFEVFPFVSERRLGISVLEVLFTLNLRVDESLDTSQLLRFITYLRYRHQWHDDHIEEPPEMLRNDFAFVTLANPYDPDSVDVLSTAGGWLYELAGCGLDDKDASISLIPVSDTFKICFLALNPLETMVLDMPGIEYIEPSVMPPNHSLLDAPEVPEQPSHISSGTGPIMIHLSRGSNHGFPFLSDCRSDEKPCFSPRGDMEYDRFGVQISTSFCNRLFRTWWKPQVEVGRPCSHHDVHCRMTRCSLTSNQVLMQVRPSVDPLSSCWTETEAVTNRQSEAEEIGTVFFRHLRETTTLLTERHGPFESGRLSIVRCGDTDGPVDPLIILAASLGLKSYVIHSQECWNCACVRMRGRRCTLGIATRTKVLTQCAYCVVADERAARLVAELGVGKG